MIFLCYDISFKGAYTTRPPTVKKVNVDTFILELIILLIYLLRPIMDNSYINDNGLVLWILHLGLAHFCASWISDSSLQSRDSEKE